MLQRAEGKREEELLWQHKGTEGAEAPTVFSDSCNCGTGWRDGCLLAPEDLHRLIFLCRRQQLVNDVEMA